MASSIEKPMPQTIEAYIRLAHRDLDLIMEMRKEIGQLKAKINKLEQSWACKDVARYHFMFESGEFDYHQDWICESKGYVDAAIDELIKRNKQ